MYGLSDLNFLITPLISSNSSYPSRASEFNPGFCGVHGALSLVFCVVFCRSLFWCFFLSIVLSVLQFTDSDYPFDIFKLFLSLLNPLNFKPSKSIVDYFQQLWCHLQLAVVSVRVHLKTHFLWILTKKFKLFLLNYFKIAINTKS